MADQDPPTDEETQAHLLTLLRELRAELAKSEPNPVLANLGQEVEDELHGWLAGQTEGQPAKLNADLFRRAVSEFSAAHPRVSQVLHQVTELVKNIGV